MNSNSQHHHSKFTILKTKEYPAPRFLGADKYKWADGKEEEFINQNQQTAINDSGSRATSRQN
jgi:hypothetical protein